MSVGVVTYVANSRVRTALLRRVTDAPATLDDLLADLDARKSAVYDARAALADRGLLRERDGVWEPTAAGQAVATHLAARDGLTDLLDAARDYLAARDLDGLPAPFRARLHELRDADVRTAPPTDPAGLAREAADAVARADRLDLATQTHLPRLTARLDDDCDTAVRVLLDDDLRASYPAALADTPALDRRATALPCSVCVTDHCALVALPAPDGTPDTTALLHVTSDPGRRWASDLFTHYWTAAETHPERPETDT